MPDSIHFLKLGRRIYRAGDWLNLVKKKYARNLNDYGRRITNRKAVEFILKPIYQNITYYLYELDLNARLAVDFDHQLSHYKFKMLAPDDYDAIVQVEKMEEWLKGTLSHRLKNKGLCLAVFDKDKIAGFNCAAVGEGYIPLLRLKMITSPNMAWSEQISISKQYRRQGLASCLRQEFYRELKLRGITKLYGHRHPLNEASRQSARKFTSNIVAKVNYLKLGTFHRLNFYRVQKKTKHSDLMVVKPNAEKHFRQQPELFSIFSPMFVVKIEEIK